MGSSTGMGSSSTDSDSTAHPSEEGSPWVKLQLSDDVPAEGSRTLAAASDGAGGLVLRQDGGSEALASGTFVDSLDDLGWSRLSMQTSEGPGGDAMKMYAAGVVEGYLTAKRIKEFHGNSRGLLDMNPENTGRLPALQRALGKLVSQLDASDGAETGSVAGQARLGFLQTRGIRDGYTLARGRTSSVLSGAPSLSMVDMLILNSDGVIDELLDKYGDEDSGTGSFLQRKTVRMRQQGGRPQRRGLRMPLSGHCTGLVRLTPDRSELYFGHTTWESFSEMTRMWKVYDFPLEGVAARRISFSSYPGCVSSTDDYYLMDSGLAVTETTLNIPGKERHVDGTQVPDFLRIMAANRLASDGEAWVRNMDSSATGTYSSQWLVLDYHRFTPGSDLAPGTFHVLEQAPGMSHFEDMSSWLNSKGYWASFDRAYFDDVRGATGDTRMESKLQLRNNQEAALYSKAETPRAQIVRRTVNDVSSLAAMRAEMSRNRGAEEPVDQPSLRLPRYTISARNDLKDAESIDVDGSPDGGVDAKITSSCLFRQLTADAVSSPAHSSVPAFRWTSPDGKELWPGYPHEGLPNVAAFDWVRVDPAQVELGQVDDGACQ